MGPRRLQHKLRYFCYAAAVVWCATVAQTSAAPRPNPAEHQRTEHDAQGLSNVTAIAQTYDDDAYDDYEDGLMYHGAAADDESDYYGLIAAELTTALLSQPGEDPLSYSADQVKDETSNDEAYALLEDGKVRRDGTLEGQRTNACKDEATLIGASNDGCKDIETDSYVMESDTESSEEYPYDY